MSSHPRRADARGPRSASGFDHLGVPGPIADALSRRGIDEPFPIQAATIPDALAGRDVAGKAPTGSGKTIAFGVPLAAGVRPAQPGRPTGLVLAPTRELAVQIAKELRPLVEAVGASVHAFHGGVRFEPQLRALRDAVTIAVACPGRLADLVQQGRVELGDVRFVVVDEADRMADMGFLPEVRRILEMTAQKRQTLLFSATLDGEVEVLVREYQTNPVRHEVEVASGPVAHLAWRVAETARTETAAEVLRRSGPSIVFTRTRHGADRLTRRLTVAGVKAVAIHGGRSQAQRSRALADFRTGKVTALVATDVAARGIHVDDVACVLQYDLPDDPKDYLHRSGRTGRAGSAGTVVSFVQPRQKGAVAALAKATKLPLEVTDVDLDALGAPHTDTQEARHEAKPEPGTDRKRTAKRPAGPPRGRGGPKRPPHRGQGRPGGAPGSKQRGQGGPPGGATAKPAGSRGKPVRTGGKPGGSGYKAKGAGPRPGSKPARSAGPKGRGR